MMPLVTVFPTPNGFPIARTSSPTFMLLDSAESIGFKSSKPVIDYYQKSKLLRVINGEVSISEINTEISGIIEGIKG